MLCGKIAAGKSTLAASLADQPATILIAEDVWLDALFSDQMASISDYVRCSSSLRDVMGPHVTALLKAGVSVVLDFPANTVEYRNWMRGIIEGASASHQLHLLEAPDELCLVRLQQRNASGGHPFAATQEQFHRVTRHFAAPSPDEGFNVIVHPQG